MKRKLWLSVLVIGWVTGLASAQVEVSPGVARVSLINGDVSSQRGDTGDWAAAALNQPVDPAGGTYSGPAIPYDVTPFSGVTFWAMAAAGTDANLRIKFPMTDDVGTDNGGLCVETAATGKCYDDYGEPFSFPADGTWHQITVRWSDPGFRQEGWGIRFPWIPAHVVSIQIQSSDKGANYDFWIDDLYFFN